VKFFPGGVKKLDSTIDFSGIKKKISLIQWITKSNENQSTSNDLEELTAADYKTICKEGKGTCVIIFLENKDN
jgi:hypothetical protein